MQYGHDRTYTNEGFATGAELGTAYKERFSLISGLSASSFLILGGAEILIFLGGADIFAFLFSHNHSIADLPFQLQTIFMAGFTFGIFFLALSLMPRKIVGSEPDHLK